MSEEMAKIYTTIGAPRASCKVTVIDPSEVKQTREGHYIGLSPTSYRILQEKRLASSIKKAEQVFGTSDVNDPDIKEAARRFASYMDACNKGDV